MSKMSKYLIRQRLNRTTQMRVGEQPVARKMGFGNDDETQDNARKYGTEYRSRRGYRGGYQDGQHGEHQPYDWGYDDERYANNMPTYPNQGGRY